MSMQLSEREKIEWGNYWWEEANKTVKRVLLVGDSVARGYRGPLNRILVERGYVVDLCALSMSIGDELLLKLLKAFFSVEEYKYEYICLQLGGQHGFGKLCCESNKERNSFKTYYKEIVLMVKEKCNKLIIVSSTPTVEEENLEKENVERNREIRIRNEIAKEVAKEVGCEYVDLWESILKQKCVHTDFIHFDKSGNEYIAKLMSVVCDI